VGQDYLNPEKLIIINALHLAEADTLYSVQRPQIRGPSVSDRDPLVKPAELVLALIMIIVLREAYYPITNQRTA